MDKIFLNMDVINLRKNIKHVLRSSRRDAINRLLYGDLCPKYAQLLYIDAATCHQLLLSESFRAFYNCRLRSASSLVVKKWPSKQIMSIAEDEKIGYCLRHWRDGLSWKDAGAYEYSLKKIAQSAHGVYDECFSLEDVKRRFDDLDRLFEHAVHHGLESRQVLIPGNFREAGGSIVHLGPDAVPCFGGAGYHRFAIAKVLNIRLPAQIGCVHVSALEHVADFFKSSS
jgi:hypothetical protein